MIVYSAFNGYSGGHLALDRADRKVTKMYISEIDKYCNAVTRYHYPDSVFLGDINNVNYKDISFQIVGKDNFIKFLNGYTTDRASNFGRYKFFRTYSEVDKFLSKRKESK